MDLAQPQWIEGETEQVKWSLEDFVNGPVLDISGDWTDDGASTELFLTRKVCLSLRRSLIIIENNGKERLMSMLFTVR